VPQARRAGALADKKNVVHPTVGLCVPQACLAGATVVKI